MSKVLNDHNGGVSETTFFHHVRQKSALDKRKAALAGDYKSWKKQAKDDGIDLNDLEYALRIDAMSLAEQVASHNRRVTYLKFMKKPIGSQLSFIDESVSDETGLTDEQREKKWTDIGYTEGARGASLVDAMTGHDPNSDTGRWITAGWEAGQASLAKGFKKGPVVTNGGGAEEPKLKRGRPAKNSGVIYMHDMEKRKVYEIGVADARPEGATPITKEEYASLRSAYEKAEDEGWDDAAPPPPADERVDERVDAPTPVDDWSDPPAPDQPIN